MGFLLFGALVTIGTTMVIATESMIGAVSVAALLSAVFFGVILMQASVRLNATEVSIRVVGIFSTTIPYHRIDEVAPWKSTGIASGMGLRVLPNETTGYLVGGPSVRITTGRTAVLVSSNAPEKLSEAIERRRALHVP